jgi:hypothetical protein
VPSWRGAKLSTGTTLPLPLFLTSTLDGGEWSVSHPCCFTLGTHWIGG